MAKLIFVNLPVSDLARSTAFYEAIGAQKNEQFCDATASCMVFSETIHVMLLTHDKYRQFTTKPIADTQKTSAVMLAITKDTRDCVDAVLGAALEKGATEPRDKMDFGWMYNRAFDDLDGHTWEVVWMDMAGFEKATGQAA